MIDLQFVRRTSHKTTDRCISIMTSSSCPHNTHTTLVWGQSKPNNSYTSLTCVAVECVVYYSAGSAVTS